MSQFARQIQRAFTYHPPNAEQVGVLSELRRTAFHFAQQLDANVPDGREKAAALSKLEECVAWANAGIVREGK